MLRIVSVCAALVLAAATFSTSAVARPGGHFSGGKSFGGGPGKMSFGGGPGKMSYGGPGKMSFGGGPGKMSYGGPGKMSYGGPGKMGYAGPGKMGYAGPGKMGYAGPGKMGYSPKYGQWQSGKGGKQYGYWQDGRHRRHYGGYWPWGVGAGLALAATWPYYGGGYGYADYGYDDCIQWRPDWGWVNVCESGGYYPY